MYGVIEPNVLFPFSTSCGVFVVVVYYNNEFAQCVDLLEINYLDHIQERKWVEMTLNKFSSVIVLEPIVFFVSSWLLADCVHNYNGESILVPLSICSGVVVVKSLTVMVIWFKLRQQVWIAD